jgi:transposase
MECIFQNDLFEYMSRFLGFRHDFTTPYYPQANGQVEAMNYILKTMLQRMVDQRKTNLCHMLFSTLWAYRTVVPTTTPPLVWPSNG